MTKIAGWVLVGVACAWLGCSSKDDEGESKNAEPDSGTVGMPSSSSGGTTPNAPADLDACVYLTVDQAEAYLGTPVEQAKRVVNAQCIYSSTVPDGTKEAAFQAAVSIIGSQTLLNFETAYKMTRTFVPLAGVGESAFVFEKKVEVRDDTQGGFVEVDEIVIVTYERSRTISFGSTGPTKDAVIAGAKAFLARLP